VGIWKLRTVLIWIKFADGFIVKANRWRIGISIRFRKWNISIGTGPINRFFGSIGTGPIHRFFV
jgi:hypothetical protein